MNRIALYLLGFFFMGLVACSEGEGEEGGEEETEETEGEGEE